MPTAESIDVATSIIEKARATIPRERALLVAISGIDASGKGHVTDRLAARLEQRGLHVGVLHADGWLNLPHIRLSAESPAEHFYHHAFRFDEMFRQLIEPLRERRSVHVEADFTEETATGFRRHRYEYHDVDVVLLEAIFLLKRGLRHRYDLSFWIDCTFETTLERALARSQEGLPPEETTRAYHTVYFPAQRLHFELDSPRDAATWILPNDPRLSRGRPA